MLTLARPLVEKVILHKGGQIRIVQSATPLAAARWGGIVGLIGDQTDLQNALGLKATVVALNAETQARIDADATLATITSLNAETQARIDSDATLATIVSLDTERQARIDADATLATITSLNAETQARIDADALKAPINNPVLTGTLRSTGTSLTRLEGTGVSAPTGASGLGAEIYNNAGGTYIESYNRTSLARGVLNLSGSAIALQVGGSTIGALSSTGLAVTGSLTSTGTATFGGGLYNEYGGGVGYIYAFTTGAYKPLRVIGSTVDVQINGSTVLAVNSGGLTATGALDLKGVGTGASSTAWLSLRDNAGTEVGWVGKGSIANSDISVNSAAGGIRLGSGATTFGRFSTTGLEVAGTITQNGVVVTLAGHSHVVADVTGLQGALDAKISSTEKGAVNGVASLDAEGKISFNQVPLIALTEVYTAATEAAQLALIAQRGDIVVRSDLNRSYIHNGGTAGTIADWTELKTPTDAVLSVDGRTGAVSLTDRYLSLSGGSITGTLAVSGAITQGGTAVALAGHTHAIAEVTGLQGALDAKLNLTGGTLTGALAGITATFSGAVGTGALSATGNIVATGAVGGSNLSGTNTGDQTSIAGITGTLAQFNAALTDADFATGGGTATGTNTGDQTTITGNAGSATVLQTARAINGVSFNGSGAITITANTPTSLTFNNGGIGAASGITFNGGAAQTISYNTIGAAAAAHTHVTSDVTGLDTALSGKQPLDADLTSIAGLVGTTGLLKKTAADTWSLDTSSYALASHTHAGVYQPADVQLDSLAALDWTANAGKVIKVNAGGTGFELSSDLTAAGGAAVWGGITGTLADQTDLNTALSGKATTTHNHDTAYAALAHTHAQSDITNLTTDLAAKAPLASPTFTGTVTTGLITAGGDITLTGQADPWIVLKSSASGVAGYGRISWQNAEGAQVASIGDYNNSASFLRITADAGVGIETGTGVLILTPATTRSAEFQTNSSTGYDSRVAFAVNGAWQGNVGWNAAQSKIYLYSNTGIYQNAATGSTIQSAVNDVVISTLSSTGLAVTGTLSATGTVTGSNLSGTNTGDQTTITGNAGSATVLQTARTINGVSFNGSANITVNAVDSTTRVPTTRLISTTAPLSGGGDLSADRTLAISAATTAAAGSMSAADKTKLDGVASGATANSSDATLLNRANHTGTQASTTITGLGTAATKNLHVATTAPASPATGDLWVDTN